MGSQALDAPRGQHFFVDGKEIIIIGLDTEDGPEHPLWQKRANLPIDDELVKDLKIRAMMHNVGVRKEGRGKDAKLIAIWGLQRVKAARKAGSKVKCEIVKDSDENLILMSLSENSHRKGLDNITMAEEANRAISLHKIPIGDVAQSMNTSIQTLKSWLKWFDLDRSVQKAVERGKVAFTAAVELADLERDKQKTALEKLIADGGRVTVAKTRAAKAEGKRESGQKSKSLTKYPPPHKRTLRKIVENGADYGLPTPFLSALRFTVGETAGSNVSGLAKLLKDIEDKKV